MEKTQFDFQEWLVKHEPKENMIYFQAYWNEALFIRDNKFIMYMEPSNIQGHIDSGNMTIANKYSSNIKVISTHTSKSILLPVIEIKLKSNSLTVKEDVTLIMRYNFHDWKISVKSTKDLEFPIELFSDGIKKDISGCYCEGFKNEWIYPSYNKSKKEFTVELYSSYEIYTFLFLLNLQLK
jgi:hypothetical protein